MGTQIKDIIDVQITRETAKITRVGFGTALIFGIHSKFAEDYRVYGDIDAVAEDFLTTDEEYIAANAYFSQALKPQQVIIGKRAANVAQVDIVTVDNVQNNVTYTVTINGTAFDYLSDADATQDEITAGLTSAINLGSEPVTATDNVDGTLDLDADVDGEAFTVAVSDDGTGLGLSVANSVANVNVASELSDLIEAGQNDWYFLILTRRTTEAEQLLDIEQAAGFIQPRLKLYGYSIDQASMITSATDDIGSVLKSLSYDRTFGIYSTDHESYPEAAWIGFQAPKDAGSSTWKFKNLVGILPDTLTDNAVTNLQSKNLNFYETVAGVNIVTGEGVVAEGEYIDVMRGADKLQTRIAERIFTNLVNLEKIPFTIQGLGIIETDIRAEIDISIDEGFLVEDSQIVTLPAIDDIEPGDKAIRFLKDVEFSAQLQGAIHKAEIRGKLTL